jgi:hypothetical protein
VTSASILDTKPSNAIINTRLKLLDNRALLLTQTLKTNPIK